MSANANIYEHAEWYMRQFAEKPEARRVRCLQTDWRFYPGEAEGAFRSDYDDTAWRSLSIPHDFSVEAEFSARHEANGYVQSGILWYRKHVAIPDAGPGKKVFLHFDGVTMSSQVWINGHFLGTHPYGFTPFWYDITPYIHRSGQALNVIAVRADSSLQPYSRFYTGAGLYRQVWLTCTDALHLEEWGVQSRVLEANGEKAVIEVRTAVRVDRYKETVWNAFDWQEGGIKDNQEVEKQAVLITTLLDSDGRVAAQARDTAVIANFSKHGFSQKLTVNQPRLWGTDDPQLYTIETRLLADGRLVDDCLTPLGIRTIDFRPDTGFALNGQGMKLKGVCLHQDAGIYGGAVPLKAWVRRLKLLKDGGCNAIRTAHHPFPREFYYACDCLGLLVMDEAFDEWQAGWTRGYLEQPYGKNKYGYYLDFAQWHEIDLRAMVRRGRVHPCIIMWSVGNEIPELYFEEGIGVLRRLVEICKEEDTTRPVTVCAEGSHMLPIHEGIMEQVDVAGYNYVFNREREAYYANIHRKHPDWVLLGSETGFEPEHWQAIREQDYAIGQFLWSGYDYMGEGVDRFGEDAGLGDTFDIARLAGSSGRMDRVLRHGYAYGMVDCTDVPNGEYFYRRSIWSEQPVLHLAVQPEEVEKYRQYRYMKADLHWNFQEGSCKTVYCFTNCQEVELFLNGASLGVRKPDLNQPYAMEWPVEYEAGILQAVGYRAGRQVCESTLATAGKPYGFRLSHEGMPLKAGGLDDAAIGIAVVDKLGVTVPDAALQVAVTVCGQGSLLGLISADMTSNASYRADSCRTVKGRCQAVVRSGMESGIIEVEVTAEGLTPSRLQLECISP